jgi:hypothetical protein
MDCGLGSVHDGFTAKGQCCLVGVASCGRLRACLLVVEVLGERGGCDDYN